MLRPRATYKTTTQQQHLTLETGANQQAPNQTSTNEIQHLVRVETSINNIEFIPTLEFVDTTNLATYNEDQHQQKHCLDSSLTDNTSCVEQHNVSATSSKETYTVERSTSEQQKQKQHHHYEQQDQQDLSLSSLIDTSDLLQQEVYPQFSLTDTASFSTYFDEPTTSSLSNGIMESTQSNIILSEQKSTTATDQMPASTTPTTRKNATIATTATTTTTSSQSNVPQSLTNPLSLSETVDEEEEIEEEIEEALEMSEEQDFSGSLPGPSKKLKQTEQMFGIEFSDTSSDEVKLKISKSKSLRSKSSEDQFKIDDDQLSGGKIAQHFVIEDEEDEESEISGDISLPMGQRLVHSKHESSELEPVLNVVLTDEEQQEEDQEPSLANQSTADDVSELQEEPKNDTEALSYTKSEVEATNFTQTSKEETLESSQAKDNKKSEAKSFTTSEKSQSFKDKSKTSKEESLSLSKAKESTKSEAKFLDISQKSLSLKEATQNRVLKPTRPELFENPDIKPLSGASSLHSEKDHSIEEIIASNQSMEMTFDDKDLSSLNPSFDIHNDTMVNELLADTPERHQQATKSNNPSKEQHVETSRLSIGESFLSSTKVSESSLNSLEDLKQKKETLTLLPKEEEVKELMDKSSLLPLQKLKEPLPKLKENISVSIVPNEQVVEEIFEKTLQSEMITDLDDSLPEQEEKPMTSQQAQQKEQENFAKNLQLKEHQAKIEQLEPWSTLQVNTKEEDDEETSLQLMKLRIMAMKIQPKEANLQLSPTGESPGPIENSQVKAMERVSLVDFAKDVLEDITEESERNSLSTQEEQNSLTQEKSTNANSKSDSKNMNNEKDNSNSTVSLNMIQMLEQKVGELQQMLANKDACLASLNLQLEQSQRRDSQNNHNSSELLGSGRDSSSLVTNSTEYRTLQEDFAQPVSFLEGLNT